MKKVIKGRYVDGAVRLLEDLRLNENADVYIIVEEKEEKQPPMPPQGMGGGMPY